jgi:hypothetical protein
MQVGAAMSNNAERWLAEQQLAALERLYTLESPPEEHEEREVMRLEARKVRLWRPATDGPAVR